MEVDELARSSTHHFETTTSFVIMLGRRYLTGTSRRSIVGTAVRPRRAWLGKLPPIRTTVKKKNNYSSVFLHFSKQDVAYSTD